MRDERRRQVAVIAAAGAVIGLLVVFARAPERRAWWSAAFDAAHAPVFALFTAVALWALSNDDRPAGSWPRRAAVAAGLAGLLAVATETAQRYTAEGGSLTDLARNAVGIVAGLLLTAGAGTGTRATRAHGAPSRGRALYLTGVALLLLSFVPLARTTVYYLQRNAAFPLLCDFQASWLKPFLEVSPDTRLDVLDASVPDVGALAAARARITFEGGTYPGFVLEEPRADWSGYQRLVLDVRSDLPTPVSLVVRIDDVHHANRFDDRFNAEVEVRPGPNVLSISLADVRHAPRDREMDMRRIRRLVVFAVRPARPFSLDFGPIRLE